MTTGITSYDYKDKKIKYGFEYLFGVNYKTFEEYLEADANWYKKNSFYTFAKIRNEKFAIEFKNCI